MKKKTNIVHSIKSCLHMMKIRRTKSMEIHLKSVSKRLDDALKKLTIPSGLYLTRLTIRYGMSYYLQFFH